MPIARRTLLGAGAAALLSRVLPGGITLSPSPKDIEMPVDEFIDEITPTEHFFVRCHTLIPEVKLTDWKLEITGLIERPQSLMLADLKKLPHVELTSVLECAGNGRAFYEPRVAGAQWRFGSVGNARWTGVRLRDVIERVSPWALCPISSAPSK
jgi:DMSO/TMAO reductase YedYZ molybdopterin-dependent catalytic subunit